MSLGLDEFVRKFGVSRETAERLVVYANLLNKWNGQINLVAKSTLSDLWARHMQDSAQIFAIAPESSETWADLGSGGGFPGAVIAILASETRPSLGVTLIESDKRKASFLQAVSRETSVRLNVIADRIEDVPPQKADVVSARALATLSNLLAYAEMHLAPGGTAIFLKGARAEQEIAAALENWRFHCDTYPSQTDNGAVILRIGEIERV